MIRCRNFVAPQYRCQHRPQKSLFCQTVLQTVRVLRCHPAWVSPFLFCQHLILTNVEKICPSFPGSYRGSWGRCRQKASHLWPPWLWKWRASRSRRWWPSWAKWSASLETGSKTIRISRSESPRAHVQTLKPSWCWLCLCATWMNQAAEPLRIQQCESVKALYWDRAVWLWTLVPIKDSERYESRCLNWNDGYLCSFTCCFRICCYQDVIAKVSLFSMAFPHFNTGNTIFFVYVFWTQTVPSSLMSLLQCNRWRGQLSWLKVGQISGSGSQSLSAWDHLGEDRCALLCRRQAGCQGGSVDGKSSCAPCFLDCSWRLPW